MAVKKVEIITSQSELPTKAKLDEAVSNFYDPDTRTFYVSKRHIVGNEVFLSYKREFTKFFLMIDPKTSDIFEYHVRGKANKPIFIEPFDATISTSGNQVSYTIEKPVAKQREKLLLSNTHVKKIVAEAKSKLDKEFVAKAKQVKEEKSDVETSVETKVEVKA